MQIVGYADKLRAQPGESMSFMVSCRSSSYRAQLVRVRHGDDNPRGPGSKIDDLDSAANGEYPGRVQKIHPGSFVAVPDDPRLRLGGSFTIQAWIYPTTIEKGRQGVVTKWDCNTGIRLRAVRGREGRACPSGSVTARPSTTVSTGVAMQGCQVVLRRRCLRRR